jgi:quercetin dioxygenase-like cupin family protein
MSAIIGQLPAGVLRAGDGEQLLQAGTTLVFKSLGHETGGAVLILEQSSPPGAIVPAHMHKTEDEFIYLVEGEMEVTIGEMTHAVRPGDLVKMPKGQPHSARMTGKVMTKSLWTVVPAGKMEHLFRALAALPADRPPDPAVMARIFAEHDVVPVPPRRP